MAKKERERKFYGELDLLRLQLRTLAKEMGVEIKDTNLMTKEECKEKIDTLNKEKYRKELEGESEVIIQELSDKDNQITNLQKEKLGLEKELASRNKKITEIELEKLELEKEKKSKEGEIKELQEINDARFDTINTNANKLDENEKEIERKNEEIAELKAERTASQISLEKKEKRIKELENTCKSLELTNSNKSLIIEELHEEIKELRNRKWYQFWK